MVSADAESREDPAVSMRRLTDLIGGYQLSAAIGALARLGVADALAEGPATSSELAARVGAHEGALTRLLEATLDAGLFAVDEDGRFASTVVGELLRSDVPGSLKRYAVVATEPWRWNAYGELTHALLTGEPGFVAAHGCLLWDYLASHRDASDSFEQSLARIGSIRDQAVAVSLDLSRFESVVDVGGGRGGLLRAVLSANPHLRGTLFDLPSVVDGAREALQQAGLAERCEVVAGDFRQAVPKGGDAYLLSWILHDWDDTAASDILRRCREAVSPGVPLFVAEMIVPERDRPGAEALLRLVRQTDLEMLAVVGGRERTAAEFGRLLAGAGFEISTILPVPNMPWSVIEAVAI